MKSAKASGFFKHAALAVLAMVSASACSHGKKVAVSTDNVAKKNDFVMWADWVKDKGARYDISFNFRNDGEKHAIFYLDELQCFRGNTPGELKHTFFNTGHRTFKAHPHKPDHSNMVCKVSGTGAYRIVLSHVYDNPNGDGITQGALLASNIEWSQPDDTHAKSKDAAPEAAAKEDK